MMMKTRAISFITDIEDTRPTAVKINNGCQSSPISTPAGQL
jgi:hypothetical protein